MQVLILLLLVAVGLWAVARLTRDGATGIPPRAAAYGAAMLVAGIALGGASGLTGAAGTLERTPNPTGVTSTKGPDDNGTPGLSDFLAFAADNIPQSSKILVVCATDPCDPTLRFWVTTRLAPRPPVERYSSADWIIFQGVEPAGTSLRAFTLKDVEQFAPGQFIARPGTRR